MLNPNEVGYKGSYCIADNIYDYILTNDFEGLGGGTTFQAVQNIPWMRVEFGRLVHI